MGPCMLKPSTEHLSVPKSVSCPVTCMDLVQREGVKVAGGRRAGMPCPRLQGPALGVLQVVAMALEGARAVQVRAPATSHAQCSS